ETQVLARGGATMSEGGEGPSIALDHGSGIVGSPVVVTGTGFPANAPVELMWSTVTGNRISGAGWEEVESSVGSVDTDADGAFTYALETPDDLGGGHTLRAVSGDAQASAVYVITPSVALIEPQVVEPGGDITITLKGVGWTQTANIYTVLIDNGY